MRHDELVMELWTVCDDYAKTADGHCGRCLPCRAAGAIEELQRLNKWAMSDEGWQPTSNYRIVPLDGYDVNLSTTSIRRVGIFAAVADGMSGTVIPRTRTERQWVRTLAQAEWRGDR